MLKKIYNLSPIFLQNLITTLYGYKLIKQRYGKIYKKELKKLKNLERNTFNFYKYQLDELNRFLLYVKENSLYYRSLLEEVRLPLKHIDELNRLPLLDKETIRLKIDDIVTRPKYTMIKSQTGGTTGKSLTVFYTKKDMQKRMAYLDYFKEQHGIKKGMRRASFSGNIIIPIKQKSKKFWRYNAALKQLFFSGFHATEENMPYYIKKLNSFKPKSMDGYPSVMVKIARYIIDNDEKLTFQPLAIFPTAETLSENDRNILETAFNCKVRNQYASSEGAPFITECTHNSLHLNIETGVFEKAEKNESTSEIYVTSFTTYGTPLIRYKIGDSLEFSEEKCGCGVNTPIVKRILGRSSDYLYSEKSGYVRVGIASSIKDIPSIKNIQFVQISKDHIIVNTVFDKNMFESNETQLLEKRLKSRLGRDVFLEIRCLDYIPVENSGKTRFIINKMNEK